MPCIDLRTKPVSEWTYYVIDHLPTMSNIYRFDTVEEAIAKFKDIPETSFSALGSSINNLRETDHIQRRNGEAVLVTDSDRTENPLWRNSEEIQAAIDKMVSDLKVRYELSTIIFGSRFPSIAIPLERNTEQVPNNYFNNKLLNPTQPDRLLTSINELYVSGQGWIKLTDFIDQLDNCRPQFIGDGCNTLFVDTLNINYADQRGHWGQADLSPFDFRILKEKTEKHLSLGVSQDSNSLNKLIRDADKRSKQNSKSNTRTNKKAKDEFII